MVLALLAVRGALLAPFALLGRSRGRAPVSPALGFWATGLVARDAAAACVPAALALAVIDHESGGDWAASHRNADGTTDVGLMQVNSANWATYGLGADPYAPAANVPARVAILAADLARYPGRLTAALDTYNAGPAAAGWVFDPGLAGAKRGEGLRLPGNQHVRVRIEAPAHEAQMIAGAGV